MNDLNEFLLARIAEDEEEASYVHHENCDSLDESPCDCPWPERIKAECEAKRQAVSVLATDLGLLGSPPFEPGNGRASRYAVAQTTLRLLALPYADHADYDPAWRP